MARLTWSGRQCRRPLGEHTVGRCNCRSATSNHSVSCPSTTTYSRTVSLTTALYDRLLRSKKGAVGKKNAAAASHALCTAASAGDIETLQLLIDAGIDPNSADYDRRSALHLAASEGMVFSTSCDLVFAGFLSIDIVFVSLVCLVGSSCASRRIPVEAQRERQRGGPFWQHAADRCAAWTIAPQQCRGQDVARERISRIHD
jgi:hypothetical protein